MPHWGAIGLVFGNGQLLNAATPSSQITKFVSTLDIKGGTMNWAFTWTPTGSIGSFDITYQMFAHKLYINQAFVQMSITASRNTEVKILNILEGSCAVRTAFSHSGTDSGMIYSLSIQRAFRAQQLLFMRACKARQDLTNLPER